LVFGFEKDDPCEGSEPSQGFKSENHFVLSIVISHLQVENKPVSPRNLIYKPKTEVLPKRSDFEFYKSGVNDENF